MRASMVQIYLHFIWGTWDRLPLITSANQQDIYSNIINRCIRMDGNVIAIGGMSDHMHLFVRFPATISVANFIKEIKGSTSHLMTHEINHDDFFKWQGAYAVFSVSQSEVPRIKSYIEHQKEHHTDHQIDNSLEL